MVRPLALVLLLFLPASAGASCLKTSAFAASRYPSGWTVLYLGVGCDEWQAPVAWIHTTDQQELGPYEPTSTGDVSARRPGKGRVWRFWFPVEELGDGDVLVIEHEGEALAGICHTDSKWTHCYAASYRKIR